MLDLAPSDTRYTKVVVTGISPDAESSIKLGPGPSGVEALEGAQVVVIGAEHLVEDAMLEDVIALVCRQLGVSRDRIDTESFRALVREWNGVANA